MPLKTIKTAFDCMMPHTIGNRVQEKDKLLHGKGYDLNFCLRVKSAEPIKIAATVVGDESGIQMEVFTIEPRLQFYGGNFMQSKTHVTMVVKIISSPLLFGDATLPRFTQPACLSINRVGTW